MQPIAIKPIQYGKRQAVKANIHGHVLYEPQNGIATGNIAIFDEEDKLVELFAYSLGKEFTDTWNDDKDILLSALAHHEIEVA